MELSAAQIRYSHWYEYANKKLGKSVKDSEAYADKKVQEYENEEIEKLAKLLDGDAK